MFGMVSKTKKLHTNDIHTVCPIYVSLKILCFFIFSDGRYDTPEHSLFGTLLNEHKDDFYQPCEPSIRPLQGPRMPWQDIHAKVEGPAARDVMINFVER